MLQTSLLRGGAAPRAGTAAAGRAARTAAQRLWAVFLLWRERARQRRALRELDRRLLDDIGRSRGEALAESRKPFWRK